MVAPSAGTDQPTTPAARFATTQWSVVLKAGQDAEEALVKLCQIYWPPLYAYIRREGHSVEEAEDLTQAFFAHILEHHAFRRVAPANGRFRSFLLVCLRHFLENEWHKQQTLKRGRGQVFISWEELKPDDRDLLNASDKMTPEKMFNRRWTLLLLERVLGRLQGECVAAHKGELFEYLKGHLTGNEMAGSYQQIAVKLGMSEGAVKVSVHRLRRRFGELLRAQIAQTVNRPEDISDEIRELFAALE